MITTTKGMMEESELEKRTGGFENDNEKTSWVEYWYQGEQVHRSVLIHLKNGVEIKAEATNIGT